MERVLNWNILSNPANWLIIFFVLYLVALIARVLYSAQTEGSPLQLPSGL